MRHDRMIRRAARSQPVRGRTPGLPAAALAQRARDGQADLVCERGGYLMEDLSRRSAREVLDEHLNLANDWVDTPLDQVLDEDLRRNVSEDIVVLINRGTFRGYDGVRQLAQMLSEELPEHGAFEYTHVAAEGKMALLEWTYEDSTVRVRDGVDSYLIEDGKIVAQTIHYTLEKR
jgi:SnoaL-like domain